MKSKILSSLLISALILLSFLSVFVVPTQAITVQAVDISSAVSGQAQWITYDSANNLAWISVGVSQNNLYKVNLATVLTQGASAVTGYQSIFGNAACTGFGSLAQGVTETTVLGGNLYATYWCGSNAIGVAQIRESDGAVLNTWTYSGPTDAQGLVTDGTKLYVCAQGKILSLTTSGTYSLLNTITGDCVNLILVGSTLWFSEGSSGIGKINTDGSGFSEVGCGGCSTAYFLGSEGSNIWFTDSAAHNLVKYDGSTFTSYPTGMTSTGPYGLTFDSTRNGFWLQGYANNKIRFFSLASAAIDATKDIITSKKPFQGFADSLNNVWNMALGSNELVHIAAPISTTTTTVTITSGTSTITTTYVTEATSATVSTNECGGPLGAKCAWTPIVIPTIHISSIERLGICDINGICREADTVIISGFEFFLAGPSIGDFLQWYVLISCCWMQLSNLNPSNGTFATLIATATPYTRNAYDPHPAPLMSVSLSPTSETKFGWLCLPDGGGPNSQYIVQYPWDCQGSSNPVNYRTLSFTAPTRTIVQIQATGTASQGQVSVFNIFT